MFTPDGRTKPYAVLGHPVGHTLSPLMHNAAFRALGWNAIYLAFDVTPDDLPKVLRAMAAMGFAGANLTVPLKEVGCQSMDHLDASALITRSVNTVCFTPHGLVGHSTDGYGFLRAYREAFGESLSGRSVFLLGTGGAGRALALVLPAEQIASLALADADPLRAQQVANEVKAIAPTLPVHVAPSLDEAERLARTCDVIIQATPLGMKPTDACPLPPGAFHPGQRVFDLIYRPADTITMRVARAAGARVANGLDMLLYQGVRAFEIWTGVQPPVNVMREALQSALEAE